MRVITFNCNGIRAAHAKGFFGWLGRQRADIVCLQETKAQADQLEPRLRAPRGWHAYFMDAEKKGYSGVAVFSRHPPDRVVYGLGEPRFDREGRYLQLDFGRLSVASLYLPSGSLSDERQQAKFAFMAFYLPVLKTQLTGEREYILCGDWNIAHRPIDLRNWRANQKNSGFLPAERAWLDEVFTTAGYIDAFRVVNPAADQYTWWSNRGQAWAKNVGWRIDYQIVSPRLRELVRAASIYKRRRFSDHAPLVMDYGCALAAFDAAAFRTPAAADVRRNR